MAVIKSSAKASRRSKKQRKWNDKYRDTLEIATKKLKRAYEDEDDNIKELLNEFKSAVDKAVKKNIMHQNK